MTATTFPTSRHSMTVARLEPFAFGALVASVAALQFSIAVAQILGAAAALLWVAIVVGHQERVDVPPMFWPLLVYAALTLVSAAFSLDPVASLIDSKQLALWLIVPVVCRLARGSRAQTLVTVIITVGGVSAIIGIFQYGILEYDNLGRRPQGSLSHYMTYSGLLMLVATAAAARLLFRRQDRTWPALLMPALLVALTLTFTRSAWVGACVAIALLLILKDFRLLAALPVLAALFFALAPAQVTARFYSMFDLQDPTNRDRVAMMRSGVRIVADHPLTGVGPDMITKVYPEYRDPMGVEPLNPHLHNIPMQIAAERGLPALAAWVWFMIALTIALIRRLRVGRYRSLAAGGLAAVAAMLAAGMFEYNFGDSEFLMLFLVLITLPFASDQDDRPAA